MHYDLNQLGDPKRFQRLVNAILMARFGEDTRLTPLQGPDGGSDGETAAGNPYMEIRYDRTSLSTSPLVQPPRPGRYIFQAKYHRTGDHRIADLRTLVVREFKQSLLKDVLRRPDRDDVNYFFLITNVASSDKALRKVDEVRRLLLLHDRHLHADVWWAESITTSLDWSPNLWRAFPELFPGRIPPLLTTTSDSPTERLSQALRLAVTDQHARDRTVKFRQVKLAHELLDLFVDLDVEFHVDDEFLRSSFAKRSRSGYGQGPIHAHGFFARQPSPSALRLLLDDDLGIPKILLEGGPGQGKSTVTQMVAQIYREKLLGIDESTSRDPSWHQLCRLRIPIRVELKDFARWMNDTATGSLEAYIAHMVGRDAGGSAFSVQDLHALVRRSAVILLLDGLDEIGNDSTRDEVLDAILATLNRFEKGLGVDLRVVLTTRPPAVVGRRTKLNGFARAILTHLNAARIDEYRSRWLATQIKTEEERKRIELSFDRRRHDPHVEALARNPMQLSVLLQFIYLKGDAFPDRRAELYHEYFKIVIDRDVEKSPKLADHRGLFEGLHAFLGFRIHGMTEIEQGRRTLDRAELVRLARQWLVKEGHDGDLAEEYFALGEERFGLIVALSGEGHGTTYGFEVQPIQEYFAAEYISERLTGTDAHVVFQHLIHRSYWREVALFLAGLRRPNEKADLVARAKAADNEESDGWREANGRLIVLQLLREGVLSQPKHVLTEAMRFVMELLDPKVLRAHSKPPTLIRALAEVGARHGDDSIFQKIEGLVRLHIESNDYHLVALIHRLASSVLPHDSYMELVLQYKGKLPRLRSLIRVAGPYESVSTLETLASSGEYWKGIPVPVLARDFWRQSVNRSVVADIAYPNGMHLALVTQFAIDHSGVRRGGRPLLRINSDQLPAIWQLEHNVQRIAGWLMSQEEDSTPIRDSMPVGEPSALSWEDGSDQSLPLEVEQCLRDLIEGSGALVSSVCHQDEATVSKKLVAYLRVIKTHLADPGISSWVACRCAIEVLHRSASAAMRSHADVRQEVDEIKERLLEFYNVGDTYASHLWHFENLALFGMPLALRLKEGGALRPLDVVIAEHERGRLHADDLAYARWLVGVPIPRTLIRPLVELCRDDIALLLRLVGNRGLKGIHVGGRLKVQDTQRILKVCRHTDDVETLSGAGSILAQSTFARIAEVDLVVKLVAAPSSLLLSRVLNVASERVGGRRLKDSERELANNVAQRILGRPEQHPFRVVNRALAFSAEADVGRTTPLFEEHPEIVEVAE